ncbi:CBS domain-containing protein [Streptacidiphilus pinicola]|uniref:CBS domain-containing protein n=1 Tax=Streptacidiphilus pinicola TaxID=2219663 RepID=A0A2X0KK05_9ACTN|nr:CBS domain-containing protein [Streptacidiphilus pinicola]RAG87289.1 CBS domain-containing protein [Streptacidiphilus pinicola]
MTTARDVMHAGAFCVGENESLLDAARMMRDHGVGALPICGQDQKLKGIITDRDIVVRCLAEGKDPGSMKAHELAGHLHCVRADDDMDTVLRKMEQHQIRRIPVIDGERLVGVISEVDLATGHREGQRLTDQQILEFMDKMYMKA